MPSTFLLENKRQYKKVINAHTHKLMREIPVAARIFASGGATLVSPYLVCV